MHLLVTGADCLLARAVIAALPQETRVRPVDIAFTAPLEGALTGDLRDPAFVEEAVQGIDAVLHLAPLYSHLGDETSTLDHATRGTYQLVNAAAAAGAGRILLGSTLDLFASQWAEYRVDESWRPRPQPTLDQLCAYLAEVALREVTRETLVPALCLRLGAVVDESTAATQPFDPRWLHVNDAVSAILRGLAVEADGWRIYHIAAAGDRAAVPVTRAADEPLSYVPQHDFAAHWPEKAQFSTLTLPDPVPVRPVQKVVVFGAGGPLGAAVAEELAAGYTLRLSDVKPIGELSQATPQSPGAPLPVEPQPPHTWQVVDVRDAGQVMAACEGMDAIINCSVVRHDFADAFRVNTIGAFNVMQAAVAHGIKRVVHTGPYMVIQRGASGYSWDDWIVDDVPPRPGTWWVYLPSKLLGQEICRIFAGHYGLEVPTLTFSQFLNPQVKHGRYIHPLSISWQDSARAVRAALEVPTLPSPYEYFHIGADIPHGVFPNEKAKRLLNWHPRDRFEEYYKRPG
jgi:nucleoside-diphosphate-sugar epimerase